MRSLLPENKLIQLRRISLTLALLLLAVSGFVFGCRILAVDVTLPFGNAVTAVPTPSAAAFFVLALALVGYEVSRKGFALLAIVPGAIGLLRLLESLFPALHSFESSLYRTSSAPGTPVAVHAVAGICIALASTVIAWLARSRVSSTRAIALAFTASVLGSVGGSVDVASITPDPVTGAYPPITHHSALPDPENFTGSVVGLMLGVYAFGGAQLFVEFMV